MTWRDWVGSKYNVGGFYDLGEHELIANKDMDYVKYENGGEATVPISETIKSGHQYGLNSI